MKGTRKNMKDQILTNDKKILHCPGCNAEYSGNAGDYWYLPDSHVFTCEPCELELELVTKKTLVTYS